jgi:hypothetical protein
MVFDPEEISHASSRSHHHPLRASICLPGCCYGTSSPIDLRNGRAPHHQKAATCKPRSEEQQQLGAPAVVAPTAVAQKSTVDTTAQTFAVTTATTTSTTTATLAPTSVQTQIQPGDTLTSAGNFATDYSIPGSSLSLGNVIDVWAAGVQNSDWNSGNAFSYGLRIGAGDLAPAAYAYHYAAQPLNWQLEARVVCVAVNGSQATLEIQGYVRLGAGHEVFQSSQTVVVDQSADQQLFVFQGEALSGIRTTTMRQMIVKTY